MAKIDELLQGAVTIAIAGHTGPDGDCVGSCMGLYLYLKKNYPWLQVDVYLESVKDVFHYIADIDKVQFSADPEKVYDCFVLLDTSSVDRIGVAEAYLHNAKRVVCIDHHITNPGIGDTHVILPKASSASEVVFTLLDPEKIDKEVATALYTGIIHDTGVLQYSNTGAITLQAVAVLIGKGIPFSEIIDHSFYEKTHAQNRAMGKVLEGSRLYLEGKVIVGVLTAEDFQTYGVEKKDMDGIVSQLRLTKGVQTAVFLYPAGEHAYKVSLRANGQMDVSRVASAFGGGGHIKASGCTMEGTPEEITEKLLGELQKQLPSRER